MAKICNPIKNTDYLSKELLDSYKKNYTDDEINKLSILDLVKDEIESGDTIDLDTFISNICGAEHREKPELKKLWDRNIPRSAVNLIVSNKQYRSECDKYSDIVHSIVDKFNSDCLHNKGSFRKDFKKHIRKTLIEDMFNQ